MSAYTGIVLFNYRLTRELGEGGFGVVYEAMHEQLGRRAAVKILHPAFARHDEVVARFFREAQAACAVGHRAIVDVTNYGRLDTGEPFIMMDFVAGRALSSVTEQDGPLPLDRLAGVFGPVASALTAAHAKGVIHRDLKPDNIMVAIEHDEIADVKLLDFGIAKLTDAKDGDVSTRAGTVMGTPNYMAPEQATDAKAVDARADVYSFAATVYAALTGRPPFEAESTTALLIALTTRPAPRLRILRPDAPQALDDVIAACMEKDPAARPATIDAAWRAMRAALGGAPSASYVAPPVPAASGSMPMMPAAPHQTTLSGASGEARAGAAAVVARRPRTVGLVIAAVGAVALVAGVVAIVAGGGGNEQTAAASEAATEEAVAIEPNAPDPEAAVVPEPKPEVAEVAEVAIAPPIDAAVASAVPVDAAVDAGVDAAKKVVKESSRPECARAALDRLARKATASQRPELRRRVERCAAAGALGRRDRDRLLQALADPPPIEPLPQTPTPTPTPPALVCSKSSFASVYRARAPSKEAAQSALRRLNKCEAEKAISTADAKTARSALTAILLSQ